MKQRNMQVLLLLIGTGMAALAGSIWMGSNAWTPEEKQLILSMWFREGMAPPADPSNRFADHLQAAEFGHRLFFDRSLSASGEVSCASCHQPSHNFTDDRALAKGLGVGMRRSMSVVGTAFSPWLMWDGRKDSLWAQALGPLEHPLEMGSNRTRLVHLVAQQHRKRYEQVFGPLPDLSHLPENAGPGENPAWNRAWQAMPEQDRRQVNRILVNLGKALAAYERRLLPGVSRFDRYVAALAAGQEQKNLLSKEERAGLKLFVGKAGCVSCHGGPLLTDHDFHNTGIPAVPGKAPDPGRAAGVSRVLEDEFNCLSEYSDAAPEQCTELRFINPDVQRKQGAFKVPGLRNVAVSAPYMHAGQKRSLREVLEHYREAPPASTGHSELHPLDLSDQELQQLEAFLKTLTAPVQAPAGFLEPPASAQP